MVSNLIMRETVSIPVFTDDEMENTSGRGRKA